MRTYKRGAVDFVRGEGVYLYDADGKEYLDFLAGISVCSLGHCHPAVVAAVTEQAERLMHVSNLFYTEPMTRLAQRLSESSLGGRVFFCNSGTEANEAAIKVARKHAHGRGIAAPEIVSFEGEFHGRTYGALSATPKLARNEALGPYLPGFVSVPDNDVEALRAAVGPNTAAVLIEPIQGESGVWPTSDEALIAAREACDAGRGAPDLRRDPDRDRADRLALGLRADAGASRRDHQRQGARRRDADRRLHHRAGGGRGAAAGRPRLDLRRRADRDQRRAGGPRRGRRPDAAALGAGARARGCGAAWRSCPASPGRAAGG